MGNLWSFLLQTLTASGAAVLVLALKAVFRDKLSPRWQFSAWGLLALVLLLPAGHGGRYVLVNWPFFVEVLVSLLTGEYGTLARVSAPVPLPPAAPPETVWDWLFLVYLAGVILLLGRYLLSYLRLRLALRRGHENAQVRRVAETYGLPACPAVEQPGLSSAFICGVLRPVLVLPEGQDDKVVLHELLHLKHHDAAWGLVICLFRCLHWCNPLLWYCADRAGNDLESLCDQRVLETLEGEDRRDYGRILLSMASEKYARVPGTSSMANGGKNIRRRIEAIARFKRYPAGMALVSVCMVLMLAAPLAMGAQAETVTSGGGLMTSVPAAMASARTTWCTTCAGALDTYAKAVLTGNVLYRAMCAPLEEQADLADRLRLSADISIWPPDSDWGAGLPKPAYVQGGYEIYNLIPVGENAYECALAVQLSEPPEGENWNEWGYHWSATQPIRAEKEGERWVVRPLGGFSASDSRNDFLYPTKDAPFSRTYAAQAGDFTVCVAYWTSCHVDSFTASGNIFSFQVFDSVPQPHAVFSSAENGENAYLVYTGDPAARPSVSRVGLAYIPLAEGDPRPALPFAGGTGQVAGSTMSGASYATRDAFDPKSDLISMGGGGGGITAEDITLEIPPASYAADLYINGEKTAELTLLPKEGGWTYGN